MTRQEAAKFFAQFAVNVLCRQADIDLKVQYSDIDHIPADLKQYVILATQLGLMKGNSQDNTFRPGDWISKAEVNAVIVRMLLKAHLSEPADQRYTHYNQAGAELGIIRQGAELEPIPRAYVALMLWRAYKPQAFVLEHQLTQDENLNKQNPIPKASYRLQNRSIFLKSKSS
ncbi:MAG: S-layer homology domain-containing protein [bacterium]|nr:S-layer homology domain-containing protein [bacterium]